MTLPPPATTAESVVFLFDVDNTLLDNDAIVAALRGRLTADFGAASASRYWDLFEALRTEVGYADYLGALQRWRLDPEFGPALGPDSSAKLLTVADALLDQPFADRLYPGALDAVAHLAQRGTTVVLSDGDIVLQPRKIRRSGVEAAVGGRVLIDVHKERSLDALQRLYPAPHYVIVDDKLRILAAMKAALGDRLTTVFPRQGHYALDPAEIAKYPAADVTVERIGDLCAIDPDDLLPAHLRTRPGPT